MSNSPLVSYTKLSPNHSGKRTHAIDRITPHCVIGQCSVETLGEIFAPTSRQASCQYGIGADGRVGMYVEEKNRSWCSSSNANDQRAITIECASDTSHPYAFTTNWSSFVWTSANVTAKRSFCGWAIRRKRSITIPPQTRWCSPFTVGLQIRAARAIGCMPVWVIWPIR